MLTSPIQLKYGPPEIRHRITGQMTADLPVGSIEVLIHRHVTLSEWTLVKACPTHWVLYWPLSTGGSILQKGVHIPLRPGRLYLIPPHTFLDTNTRKTFSKWFVHFDLGGLAHPCTPGVYEQVPTRRMRSLLTITCPAQGKAQTDASRGQPWLLVELIALVLAQAGPEIRKPSLQDARLDQIIERMKKNLATKMTIQGLGRQVGLSPRSLTHLFIKGTGFPPNRYLIELRLNHCCHLLRHTPQPVEAIAEQCGFANRFYMSRLLKKYRFATPAAYRSSAKPF